MFPKQISTLLKVSKVVWSIYRFTFETIKFSKLVRGQARKSSYKSRVILSCNHYRISPITEKNSDSCRITQLSSQDSPVSPSHWAFSSNLFHGIIVQIAILQLSNLENKKCSPWKVFGIHHPQTLQLLSRRGPRSLDMRQSQHCIDISKFLLKKITTPKVV